MQLKEALFKAATSFEEVQISTPQLDAKVLLKAVLKKDDAFLILHHDYELSAEQQETYQAYIKRRCNREPVAKILGVKEFWGLPFKTTTETLDPRPDSETLVEAVLSAVKDNPPGNILDLGTGTGCLLLSLLHELPKANGVGIDQSERALAVAKENAVNLELESRSAFIQSNWCDQVSGTFDIIISNPPYIKPSDEGRLEEELSFDPSAALYADSADGLSAYRALSQEIQNVCHRDSIIFLEIGQGQEDDVTNIMQDAGFKCLKWMPDLSGINRCGSFIL